MTERKQLRAVLWSVVLSWVGVTVVPCSADWPMWRHDGNRSAASPAGLPAELHLQWKREMPPPRPGFPEDLRLCFDLSYEPVVMDGTMFVPSMVTDSVTALDTSTGVARWQFFADGPIRFAPVAWRGKVYFVSDDGHLYCLDAANGRLLWKVSPLPPDRRRYRLLGNERLISRWPARGGPVLADGVVYFAAGIWPFEGVYVCAVDAETGKLLWANEDTGFIENGLIDHGTRRHGGLSPQGYLALVGEKLIVPSGKALPGFFDPKSGEMDPYTTGWGGRVALAKGCWYVAGIGDYFFQSGDVYGLTARAGDIGPADEPKELLTLEQFARRANAPLETVQQWVEKDKLATVEQEGELLIQAEKRSTITYLSWWSDPLRTGEEHTLQAHPRLQIDPANNSELGVFREPVLTEDAIYYSRPVGNTRGRGAHWPTDLSYEDIVACDLTAPRWRLTPKGGWGNPWRFVVWKTMGFDQLWSLPSDLKVHIKAGSRLYAGGPGVVAAVDIPEPGGEPKVSWRAEIEGTPSSILAADGKLFVVTGEGCIYCFGGEAVEPKMYGLETASAGADEWTTRAGDILKQTGVTDGYCLALGLGTGRLVEELARQSDLHTIALDSDGERVAAARRKLDAVGLYGTRIHILPEDPATVRLAPYVASLVVSENLTDRGQSSRLAGRLPPSRLFDWLRPYGGVACLPIQQQEHATPAEWVKQVKLAGAEVERVGNLTLLRRAGALPGSADWTHESGSAANRFASADERVKPPFAVLWFGGSVDRIFPPWDYTHSRGPLPVIACGRMFILVANELSATDIYTGRLLWKLSLDESAQTKGRRKSHVIAQRGIAGNFAAAEDSLYVVCEGTCRRLDPATGLKLGEIEIPEGLTEDDRAIWQEVRIWKDHFVGATGKHLLCLDRHSGQELWRSQSQQDRFSFAVGAGKVFCVDYWLPVHRRRGEPKTEQSTIFALDVASGDVLWQTTANTPAHSADEKTKSGFGSLQPQLSYCEASDVLLLTQNRSIASAYRGADGEPLWAQDIPCRDIPSNYSGPEPPILLPEVLITHAGEMYDPRTGSRLEERLWTGMNTRSNSGGIRGCGRALANRYVVVLRDAHAAYFDLATGRETFFRGIRSGCTNSLIPAGGLLNGPNFAHGCSCNWPIFASFTLVHMPEAATWAQSSSDDAGGM